MPRERSTKHYMLQLFVMRCMVLRKPSRFRGSQEFER